ncbi:conserved phage C-terminal domain-containing protein, partial [Tatumella saanichensis]|uniref:conserved phage C-terminal domain-containing protein n=1 Tax=Tatumella saanichensis TaxID=480813 RepID=UPI0004A27E3C
MSVELSSHVWDGCAASDVKGTQLLVMARLADFSSDEGTCFPGIDTIARQVGAGRSTVITAITQLQNAGWLTLKERRTGNRNKTNMYYLNVKKLRDAASAYCPDSPENEHSNTEHSNTKYSDLEHSESERTESERSESGENTGFDRPESGGDPSVTSKPDPSVKSKPFCQVAPQPDPDVVITDQAREVLKHLNQTTGSRFTASNSSLENIRGRLREKYTPEELQLVVDYKTGDWRGTEQEQYLRPATLFIPKNFPGYLQRAGKWDTAGRPKKLNGR